MSQHQVLLVTWLSLSLEVRAIIVVGGQNNPDRERSRLLLSLGSQGCYCRGRSE